MLKEAFIGRVPTSFHVNPLVKAFIVSEMVMWSAYNLFFPILSIFVITIIPGGSVEMAAILFSFYMIVRVVVEIISGTLLSKPSEHRKFNFIFYGLIVLSLAYITLSLANSVVFLFLGYGIMGIGLGVATPARLALFSNHLDKDKEAKEWSLHDATSFIGMALAGALGGFIAQKFGFSTLFLLAAITNVIAVIPYFSFYRELKSAAKIR